MRWIGFAMSGTGFRSATARGGVYTMDVIKNFAAGTRGIE